MNALSDIKRKKKLLGLTWDELAEGLPITGNSLRIAFGRGNVDEAYIYTISNNLSAHSDTNNTLNEPPTTYSKVPEQTQTLDTMDDNYLRKYVQLLEKNLQEKEEIINQQKEEINALKSRKA